MVTRKRYIVGNLHLNQEYLSGVKEMLEILEEACELSKRYKSRGLLLTYMGDFIWNDNTVNQYGEYIEKRPDWSKFCMQYSVCVQPSFSSTFLAANGNSHKDFFVKSTYSAKAELEVVLGYSVANANAKQLHSVNSIIKVPRVMKSRLFRC